MSDPPRLLEDSSEELSDSVRRLLVAGTEAAPPSELGAQVWSGLAAKLPGSSGNVQPAHGAGGATHVTGLLLKAALGVVALGALVLGARALLFNGRPAPAPLQAKPALIPSAALTPPAPSAAVDLSPPQAPVPLASALPPRAPSVAHSGRLTPSHAPAAAAAAPPSDASEESRLVAAARDALRGGNSAGALSLLGQAQQRFGSGVLGQEREALTIEALAKSGQHAAAQARGQAFLKNYANSPYSARIRALVGAN